MFRTLLLSCTIFILAGCDPSTDPTLASNPLIKEQVVIISGFGQADTAVVGSNGMRVGDYYNFESYDSLSINFTARRLAMTPTYDHILVKLGPAYYLSDSLLSPQKNFSLTVKPFDLAKPQFSALTFIITDEEVSLVLSQLRVIGWRAR
jgi:hypothetical protein